MLFNSTIFLFVFLPLCGLGYWLILRFIGRYAAYAMLLLASLTFYAWWDIGNLLLLLSLILVNFFLGEHLRSPASQNSKVRRGWLIAGVTLNLAVLGVFKYSNFILANLALVGVGNGSALSLLLPLGISFYTFQQIAYLIDCWKGRVRNGRLVDYSLFVLFFPQLIAGPIVHHRYFFHHLRRRLGEKRIAFAWCGLALLLIGLFKKVVLADNFALIAGPGFDQPQAGHSIWMAVIAYTLQIYFDFSGYSDMAIGLAALFGVRLPLNFSSPYRATSIVEFWRRWHITLSTFLRDYLYIPLGGNRNGRWQRQRNLMLTMLIGGVWHGASWNFILWGALHGFYLSLNHGWHACGKLRQLWMRLPGHSLLGWTLTLLLVAWAWVPFRAPDLSTTLVIWQALLQGPAGSWAWPAFGANLLPDLLEVHASTHIVWVLAGFSIVLLLPNSQTVVGYRQDGVLPEMPSAALMFGVTILGLLAIKAIISEVPSVFLYFNF